MSKNKIDIKKLLLREHSKKMVFQIGTYIGNNPKRFKELIDIFLQGPYRITQRASWPISYLTEKNPKLIVPHLTMMIKILERKDVHEAVKRNILRLLQFVDIPKRNYGKVVNLCFAFMDSKQPIAVRVFAMQVLCNVSKHVPQLKPELTLAIEDQLPYASAGIRSRALKLLKELKK